MKVLHKLRFLVDSSLPTYIVSLVLLVALLVVLSGTPRVQALLPEIDGALAGITAKR